MHEGQAIEHKALRKVIGPQSDFEDLAQTCVCLANSAGGLIRIGIEDGSNAPPPDQRISADVPDRIRKRLGELTVNVQALPAIVRHDGGGESIDLAVARSPGVASTRDGRYFLRVGDTCQPITGDDVLRLANERPALPWESMTSLGVPREGADSSSLNRLVAALRDSERVKASVKEKSPEELLEHYGLASGPLLTHLGVLLLGTAHDRMRLGSAPIIQAIRYDERGTKIEKLVWDDYTLGPIELIAAIWTAVPDFRESYELPDGLFRSRVPAFEEAVVRELLVNALVHRPYTQRGDIFLNLHPDRLEVVNPGRLPLGVTPRNILHQSRRRNDGLARIFHDLKLMEREGSGFDLLYERLLSSGRATPTVREGTDSVHVTVPRRLIQPAVIRLLAEADQRHQLSQRERIVLGLLAQSEGLTAAELVDRLELENTAALKTWGLSHLTEMGLVAHTGRTQATRYFVPPALLRLAGLDQRTTLARVEPHRLRALILEDLERYPNSSRTRIHERIGPEIHPKVVLRALSTLISQGTIVPIGRNRARVYRLAEGQTSP